MPFAQRIESLYVCIPDLYTHHPTRVLTWTSLLLKLPNLMHICISDNDPLSEGEQQESFQALMSLPRLWNIRMDWKLNKQLLGTKLPDSRRLTHFTLSHLPDLESLATFTRLTHLLILIAGDMWTGTLWVAVNRILDTIKTLKVLVLSDKYKVVASRIDFSSKDPRVVCQFRPTWSALADAKDWEKFTKGDVDCVWAQAETIVEERLNNLGRGELL